MEGCSGDCLPSCVGVPVLVGGMPTLAVGHLADVLVLALAWARTHICMHACTHDIHTAQAKHENRSENLSG